MIIAKAAQQHFICKDCKHAACEGGSNYVCTQMQDLVTGYSPPCSLARVDGHCGLDGKWFERRYNVAAYVDQAPITTYLKDDGSLHPRPIAENDKLKAYHPRDVNLDEWKKD